jgi:hypothetical protein
MREWSVIWDMGGLGERYRILLLFAIMPAAMEDRASAILIAASAIVAPRLRGLKDSPALRCAIHDAIDGPPSRLLMVLSGR